MTSVSLAPQSPDVENPRLNGDARSLPESSSPSPVVRTAGPRVPWSRRTRSVTGVRIAGTGSAVPANNVTNLDLQLQRGFDPAWIEQRTGILQRRIAPRGTSTSDLCVDAARKALEAAQVTAADVDLVIVGTFTPDFLCPSTANLVQDRLDIDGPAFDIAAACSGFVYALATAAQFVNTGNSRCALVIGGDCNSRIVDPTDQKVAPLFGDGAGAVVLKPGSGEQGLTCYQLGSDGSGAPLLDRRGGTARLECQPEENGAVDALAVCASNGAQPGADVGDSPYLHMDGRNVFKWAVRALTESIRLVLAESKLGVNDVACYVLHQANIRIISKAAEELGIPAERLFNNLQNYGNTSGGSVPIALDEAFRAGRIRPGDAVLLSGFGAGLTWGTSIFRW